MHVLRYVKGSSRVAAVGVAVISLYGVSCRRLENFNRVLIGKEPARSGRLVLYWGWKGVFGLGFRGSLVLRVCFGIFRVFVEDCESGAWRLDSFNCFCFFSVGFS